ncbi:rhodanese-like domain-containing protein [Acidiplasma cupricumulans]|nr:rhodanese-like domain-containing protein [Acidiplasma cupricumulans]
MMIWLINMSLKDYLRGKDYFIDPPELEPLKPEDVMKRLNEYKIIDVRTGIEFRRGHIKNAVHYKLGREDDIVKDFGRDAKIILVCKTGHRSRAAANRLARMGYKKLYHLDGGMNTWRKEKLPEEKGK